MNATTVEQQHPTKSQWDEIAKQLDRQFSSVYLRCDGFLVHASLERVSNNKLGIVVGVNGWHYKGVWMLDGWKEHEEPRRFWRRTNHQRMEAKELKLWEKLLGKRECMARGYYEPNVHASPYWLRPRPFIAHLRKHNQHIEILDYDTFSLALEAMRVAEAERVETEVAA